MSNLLLICQPPNGHRELRDYGLLRHRLTSRLLGIAIGVLLTLLGLLLVSPKPTSATPPKDTQADSQTDPQATDSQATDSQAADAQAADAQVNDSARDDPRAVDSKSNASSGTTSLGVRKIGGLAYNKLTDGAGLCDVFLPLEPSDPQKNNEPGEIDQQDDDPDQTASARRWPVILAVHGGGWATGDKWTMDRHARELAKHGFASVSINYRLAPKFKFPAQLDDVRTALVWINDQAKEYEFDLNRVGLYGYSAGGHLVALASTLTDEPWSKVKSTTTWPENDQRWKKIPKISAVCAGGPPTDFRVLPPDNTSLAYFLGGSRRDVPEIYRAASPICFVSTNDPPLKIIHGEADGIVPLKGSEAFCRAAAKCNADASLLTLPRNGHMLAFISSKFTRALVAFFDERLGQARLGQARPATAGQ